MSLKSVEPKSNLRVALADSYYAVHRLAYDAYHRGKRHLLRQLGVSASNSSVKSDKRLISCAAPPGSLKHSGHTYRRHLCWKKFRCR